MRIELTQISLTLFMEIRIQSDVRVYCRRVAHTDLSSVGFRLVQMGITYVGTVRFSALPVPSKGYSLTEQIS
jgi:hypothetical protein